MTRYRNGFTLAEVLLTIVIIGMVAMFAIPATINNINRTQYIAGAQKAYGVLNQVFEYAYMDDFCVGNPAAGTTEQSQIEYEKDCVDNDQMLTSIQTIVEKIFTKALITTEKNTDITEPFFVTRDNIKYTFSDFNANCGFAADKYNGEGAENLTPETACAKITIDTNSNQGPNKVTMLADNTTKNWSDQYEFYLYKDGIYCLPGQDITKIKKR